MKTMARPLVVGSAILLLAGCGGGAEQAQTTTVTVSATSSPAATPTAAPANNADQTFIQSITMFSGYWARKSSDSAGLIALGHTVCNYVAEAKAVTTNATTIIAGTASKVILDMGSDPPSFDDAEQFVRSSVNIYCPGSIG